MERKQNGKLLNIFFTAGYPMLHSLDEILPSLVAAGVDMIEIGLPYSDPLADGQLIQETSKVALQNGMHIDILFEQLDRNHESVSALPVYIMGYFNQFLQYGPDRFLARCFNAGVKGLILPDLPMEYYESEYALLFKKWQVGISFLVCPVTSVDRLAKADRLSTGFVYAVSQSATTGSKLAANTTLKTYLQQLQNRTWKNKVLLGFGIQQHSDFETACAYLDGAIVGSAFLQHIKQHGSDREGIIKFIKSIRND